MTGVFRASFSGKVGKYCSCVMVEIRRCQSLRVTSLGTSPRPDGLGIIAGFGSRITLLGSKNSCETTTPFMSLLLVHVSRGPLCTYPSTLCVYHAPMIILSIFTILLIFIISCILAIPFTHMVSSTLLASGPRRRFSGEWFFSNMMNRDLR